MANWTTTWRRSRWVAAIGGLVLSSVTAGADVAQGVAAFNESRYGEAVTMLRDQKGADARAYLAASLVRLGRTAAADEKRGRLAEAETCAREALAADAGHAVAAEALGEALLGQNKQDEAISALSSVLTARPDAAYAYYWRGKAYNVKKETARMVDDFQHFLKLAPQAAEAASVRQLLQALQ
jgi:tetratricopeptide (TPR) repeat protein